MLAQDSGGEGGGDGGDGDGGGGWEVAVVAVVFTISLCLPQTPHGTARSLLPDFPLGSREILRSVFEGQRMMRERR